MSLLAEQKNCKQERFAPERVSLLSFNFTRDLYCILSFCGEWNTILISVQSCIIVLVVYKAGDKHMWYSWSQHRGAEWYAHGMWLVTYQNFSGMSSSFPSKLG
jgi:hypothetical protein